MRGPPPINGRCGGRQTEAARDTVTTRWPGDGVCAETVARRRTLCGRWVMEAALAAVQRETHVEWRGATVVQRKGHGVVVEHADQWSLYGTMKITGKQHHGTRELDCFDKKGIAEPVSKLNSPRGDESETAWLVDCKHMCPPCEDRPQQT
uniref:Uncharacterized protein n=1 Tax=Triticum urartu TaxID=4572 RepID=A0A8R7JWQ1_TRIUA